MKFCNVPGTTEKSMVKEIDNIPLSKSLFPTKQRHQQTSKQIKAIVSDND